MIGLLGAQIWVRNRVDFGRPVNLIPAAAGVIVGIGDVSLKITGDFELSGIALGTLLVLTGYHALNALSKAAGTYQPPLLDAGLTEYDDDLK